ncbi:MAG TPA: hypothetical protein VEH57_05765 [Thermoplasmata archaeon]|nr:hypothetical protein [Thermoplasmata archaeon]
MATTVLLPAGPWVVMVPLEGGTPTSFSRSPDRRPVVSALADPRKAPLPAALWEAIRALSPSTRLAVASGVLRAEVERETGQPFQPATLEELRAARTRCPWPTGNEERGYVRQVAGASLEEALRSPVEVLITFAREEERVERAVEREARASESFLAAPGSALDEYVVAWRKSRAQLVTHHRALLDALEREARQTVPNLSAVVGARVAARLVAEAGGLTPLGRMRASRLQLLGSRRRPSPERGPRFGVLYRADRMDDVPPGRRAAYARSLAALAAIAVRADATTHANIAPVLLARRDRRIQDLSRRRT